LAKQIGDYLIRGTQSDDLFFRPLNDHPNIVKLGRGLINKLLSLKNEIKDDCSTVVSMGDSKYGDGTATHHIVLQCKKIEMIVVRLKYDKQSKYFHILGYWTSDLK